MFLFFKKSTISKKDYECWKNHLLADELLYLEEYSSQDLENLTQRNNTWRLEALECFPSPEFSWKVPNFNTTTYWRQSIEFLGTPLFQDTLAYENFHQIMKEIGLLTNKMKIDRDVLIKVSKTIKTILS